MSEYRTALVLGATGGVGGTVAATLARRGWTVRALTRDPGRADAGWKDRGTRPEWIAGDAMIAQDVVRAALGHGGGNGRVDAIVHAVNPPGYRDWDRLVLPMMTNTIAAARAAGGARVVLPGTLYNFDPARSPVIDETTPQQPRSRKGAIRVRLERMLEDAAPEVPGLIVRAGDYFGPDARSSWFSQCLITPGRRIRRLLDPTRGPGHSWAYLPDLAEAIVRLIEQEDHLTRFERVQFEGCHDAAGTDLADGLRRVTGRDLPVRKFPWWMMRIAAPFGGFPREAMEIEPFWRYPVRLDNTRLVALLGAEPRTQLDEALAITLAALGCLDRSAGPARGPDQGTARGSDRGPA